MAQDYTEYLAINVLNEQQIVSYRLLSRALKVHVNLAKQMLYEFHRKQNAKKPGSVHATYLLTGSRRPLPTPSQTNGAHSQENAGDTVMRSSPPLPSSSFPQPDSQSASEALPLIRSIMLVKEEHLEQAKGTFEQISSIHIYSLEASSFSDVQVLTECNRKVAADYASEDPLEAWKQYGTIQNPHVKRRKRGTAPPPPAPVTKPAEPKTKPAPAPTTKPAQPPEPKPTDTKPTAKPDSKPSKPAPVKRQSSDIFKSFSKTTPKPKEDSQNSTAASPAPAEEDAAMTGFSSDEGGDDDDEPPEPEKEPATDATGKTKQQRAAELAAMMEAEDEEMDDAPAVDAGLEEPENAIDTPATPKEEEPKETVQVENGRRRGRRRVMKKVTAKDEEGYLVTREEAAWESFSEDEPVAKKAKLQSSFSNAKPAAKKGPSKPQGNIMSFFGKK